MLFSPNFFHIQKSQARLIAMTHSEGCSGPSALGISTPCQSFSLQNLTSLPSTTASLGLNKWLKSCNSRMKTNIFPKCKAWQRESVTLNIPVVYNLQCLSHVGQQVCKEQQVPQQHFPIPRQDPLLCLCTRGLGTESSKPQEQRLFWFAFTWQSRLRVFNSPPPPALLWVLFGVTGNCTVLFQNKASFQTREATRCPVGCRGQ